MFNFVIQEKRDAVPWFYEVAEGHMPVGGGFTYLPEKPGSGIEVNKKVAAKYPYKQELIRIIQAATISGGTIVHW